MRIILIRSNEDTAETQKHIINQTEKDKKYMQESEKHQEHDAVRGMHMKKITEHYVSN